MDLAIDTLVVDEHRLEHITRHQVTIEEVQEIVSGDYAYIQGHHERWLLIGKTSQGRFITGCGRGQIEGKYLRAGHCEASQPRGTKLLS